MIPVRIQRVRNIKGWHYPAGNVLTVTRTAKGPGVFGNPFRVCKRAGYQGWVVERNGGLVAFGFETKRLASQFAVDRYREHLAEIAENDPELYAWMMERVGRADWLGCWCDEKDPCHGAVLIEAWEKWKEGSK